MEGDNYNCGLWHLSWLKEGSEDTGQWWRVERVRVSGHRDSGVRQKVLTMPRADKFRSCVTKKRVLEKLLNIRQFCRRAGPMDEWVLRFPLFVMVKFPLLFLCPSSPREEDKETK